MNITDSPLPTDWKLSRIGDAYEFTKKPRTISLAKYERQVPFFAMDQIPLGRVYVSAFTPKEPAKISSGTYVENGDLMVAKITPSFENGKQAIVDIDNDFAYATTEVIPLRGIAGLSDTLFLYFFLKHPEVRSALAGKMEGSTGRQRLGAAVLADCIIPLPPLREQQRIASVLSTIQQTIEDQERIIDTTTELKKALMQKLFTEGLRGEKRKMTEVGLVPESWAITPLGECAKVQTGIAKGRRVSSDEALNVPYLRVANVQDGHLDLQEVKSITLKKTEYQRYALQDGDILLTEGGDFDKLGRGCLWHGQINPCVHQNHIFAVRPDTSKVTNEFLAYQAQSPYGKKYFLSVAHKTTNLACINTTKLKAFPVLLPSRSEQLDIAGACQEIDRKISRHERKKRMLLQLFETMVDKTLRGHIQHTPLTS